MFDKIPGHFGSILAEIYMFSQWQIFFQDAVRIKLVLSE